MDVRGVAVPGRNLADEDLISILPGHPVPISLLFSIDSVMPNTFIVLSVRRFHILIKDSLKYKLVFCLVP